MPPSPTSDDATLLRRYATEQAEDAFAELVRRHGGFVYATALRRTSGRAALAEEVTQSVFSDLARKAAKLPDRLVLAGWLHASTRFAAANALRAERRRWLREQAAFAQHLTSDGDAPTDWERVRPAIDEALDSLGAADREAVLLRFFGDRPFAEIGARLRLSENAARKRVERALNRMAAVLTRRGVASTAGALAAALGSAAAESHPLPASVTDRVIAATHASAGALGSAWPAGWLLALATSALCLLLVPGLRPSSRELVAAAIAAETRRDALTAEVRRHERVVGQAEREAQAAASDRQRLLAALADSSLAGVVDPDPSRLAFVIDTSGSMRNPQDGQLYATVLNAIDRTLTSNSSVRHFLLFDGNGRTIAPQTKNDWWSNEPEQRVAALTALARYDQDTVSNPVPGLYQALRAFDAIRSPLARLEVCIVGDEFNSSDPIDAALADADVLNPSDERGRRRVTISALAFPTWQMAATATPASVAFASPPRTFARFERLMREITRQHGGTFAVLGGPGEAGGR